MSNHLHLIVSVEKQEGITLSTVIRDFKKYTARTIIQSIKTEPESRRAWLIPQFQFYAKKHGLKLQTHQFWHHDNHPIELWSPRIIQQKLNYIHRNPVKAGWVAKPEHYLYCSASNYLTGNGLIDVLIFGGNWIDTTI